MTLAEMCERLTKHSRDCVEKQLLLDVVVEIERMQHRIQHLVCENDYLEKQLTRNMD
jgi:hypothetical protein